jgi:hypothetical protein
MLERTYHRVELYRKEGMNRISQRSKARDRREGSAYHREKAGDELSDIETCNGKHVRQPCMATQEEEGSSPLLATRPPPYQNERAYEVKIPK